MQTVTQKRRSSPLMVMIGLVLVMAALVASACVAPAAPAPVATTVPPEPSAASAGPQGALRVAIDIPVQLDPAFASSDAEIAILNAVYDYLIDVDENNRLQRRLAQTARITPNGLNYTFELHPDARFHDGSPVTAADVIYTFNRLRDPEAGLPTSDLYSNIVDIFAPGDVDPAQSKTVIFQLTQPDPFFQYSLSDNHAVIVKAGTEDFRTAFNGSGPFKVVSYSPENRMELAANPDYFLAGKPGVATLDFIFFSDQAASVDALRGGQIDLALRMPTPLYLTLQGQRGIQTVSAPTNGFDLVRLRADQEPGNKPEVIEAFKLATDRQAIFDQVALSLGAVGRDSPIGPLFADYYSEATPLPARDPAKARDLLAAAGYENGLTLDLHVPDSGDRPDLAVVLKEQWAEAGITVNVIVEPESVYYGDNGWLEVPLGITGWGSRPTPQFYFDVMLVCGAIWNESRFCDEEFDALARTAGTTLDERERIAAYGEMQRILIERGPIIVPYFFAQLGAIRDGFDGFALKAFAGRTDLAAIRAR